MDVGEIGLKDAKLIELAQADIEQRSTVVVVVVDSSSSTTSSSSSNKVLNKDHEVSWGLNRRLVVVAQGMLGRVQDIVGSRMGQNGNQEQYTKNLCHVDMHGTLISERKLGLFVSMSTHENTCFMYKILSYRVTHTNTDIIIISNKIHISLATGATCVAV
jgi:hypothetical protein